MSVEIAEEHSQAIRSVMRGDVQEFNSLVKKTLADGTNPVLGLALSAAFQEALFRRVGHDPMSNSEIIKFVAKVRSRFADGPGSIDALSVERIMQTVYGDLSAADKLTDEEHNAFIPMLFELALDAHLDAAEVEEFVEAAKNRTVQMISYLESVGQAPI